MSRRLTTRNPKPDAGIAGALIGVVVVLIAVALAGLSATIIGVTKSGGIDEEFWDLIANSGIQVGVTSVVGAILSGSLAWLESRRRRHKQLTERRTALLRDLERAYSSMKAVRRELRSLGCRDIAGKQVEQWQAEGIRSQMTKLIEAQLLFESMRRMLESHPHDFDSASKIATLIESVHDYLHDLIEEWEDLGAQVASGGAGDIINSMKRLQGFIGTPSVFRDGAGEPMSQVRQLLRIQVI